MFGNRKLEEKNQKLTYELDDAKDTIKRLRAEAKTFDKQLEAKDLALAEKLEKRDYADRKTERARTEEMEVLKGESAKLKTAHKEEVTELKTQIETLTGQVESAQVLNKREIELDNREVVIEAQEENSKNFKAKLAEAKKDGEKVAEDRYRAGYADGIADGLRKAHEITAEDRRATVQIAALAAASHQPDLTKQIAQSLAKDFTKALPSGTAPRKK